MFWKLKNRTKKAFILLEVLTALSLLAFFLPSLFKNQKIYRLEIEKLSFYNAFECAFKEQAFNLYERLYDDKYYDQIKNLDLMPLTVKYPDTLINGKAYKTLLILSKNNESSESKNYQVKASLRVVGLPYNRKSYESNTQNFYLKKY
ncbi:MAG: hypothetical protein S4CHLAM6_15750 [Chlamydiae bacterium]|nr:hypothetical protein [Chlamydiota bacterium]